MSRRSTMAGCLAAATLVATGIASGPAHAASPFAGTEYVALGDSYSSGVGAPGQRGLCRQSPLGFPGQWVTSNQPGTYTDLSCSGAVTGSVIEQQVPKLSASADLITLTVGGNDVGFVPVVLRCKVSSAETCRRVVDSASAGITGQLPAKLDATYAAIRAKAPDARVIVFSYPITFDTSSADCGIGAMSLANRKTVNQGIEVLNEVLRDRAAAAGFGYVDVGSNFAGHGVCSAEPYLIGLAPQAPLDSYHPNQQGYRYGYLRGLTSSLA